MPESLLERNRRNLIEPDRLFLLLEQYQTLCGSLVVQTLTTLVVRISTLSQCPIIDIATTPEGLRQYVFLFIAWGEAILGGSLLFHALQHSTYAVNCQGRVAFIPPPATGRVFPLLSDKFGKMVRSMKWLNCPADRKAPRAKT